MQQVHGNTTLGYLALEENTTGGNNTAVGFQSLDGYTTAFNNTGLGYFALRKNTTGAFNVSVGANLASDALTTGSQKCCYRSCRFRFRYKRF